MENNANCVTKDQQKPILIILIEKLNSKINDIDDRLFVSHDIINEINIDIKNMSGIEGISKCIPELVKPIDSNNIPCTLEIMQNNIDRLDDVINLLKNMIDRQEKINLNLKQIV